MEGWIKLHRKILDYRTMFNSRDRFTIFCWLLLMANREGQVTCGRFQIARELRITPANVYKTIKWLASEKIINTKSNNKFTTISICKWGEYQQQSNNKVAPRVTTKEQQSSTIQEYKNKEYITLSSIGESDFQEIADKYQVPLAFVKSKYDDMVLWAGQKTNNPKTKGRNWRLTLMNWVKKDAIKIIERRSYDPKRAIDASNL